MTCRCRLSNDRARRAEHKSSADVLSATSVMIVCNAADVVLAYEEAGW